MIEHARVESQNHAFHYNEKLGVESCTQAICDLALRFGEGAQGEESIMSRPFGVALLIAGWDVDNGPQLYGPKTTRQSESRTSTDMSAATTPNHQAHSTDTTPKPSAPAVKVRRPNCSPSTTDLSHSMRPRLWC